MKIIFLDIDGVLNSESSCQAYGGYPWPQKDYDRFQDVSVKLLQKLVRITGAKVVLSSTWRETIDSLELFGDFLGIPIIDKTRLGPSGEARGLQIQTWLNNYKGEDPIESYIIIDDNSDMLPDQMRNFVQTDSEIGFMVPQYRQATDLLLGSVWDNPISSALF